jgi:hypothetical protein
MQGDGSDAQVPKQQCHTLGIVTRTAKDHEGVPSQLVDDGHQVTILETQPVNLQSNTNHTQLLTSQRQMTLIPLEHQTSSTLYLEGMKT